METNAVEVDDAIFEVLADFSLAADKIKAPWLIIGATARIILLEQTYGWPQGLGTLVLYQGDNLGFSLSVSVHGKARLAANGHSPLQEAERSHGH